MLRERSSLLINIHKLLDMILVTISFITSYYIKWTLPVEHLRGLSIAPNYYIILLLTLIASFVIFQLSGFYEPYRKQLFKHIARQISFGVLGVIITVTFILYLFHQADISRMFLGMFAVILTCNLLISKSLIYYLLRYHRTKDLNIINILIVGSRQRAIDAIKALIKNPGSGYRVMGCLETVDQDKRIGKEVYRGVKIIGTLDIFSSLIVDQTVDEVLFAMPLNEIEGVEKYINFAEELGINIRVMPDFQIQKIMYRPETAKIYMEQFVGLPTIALSSVPSQTTELVLKAFIDYIGAGVGLLVFSPFFIVIALLIKFTSKGPVFFRQKRCGLYGRTFDLIKFRTMVEDAEKIRETLMELNEMDGPVFKIKDDPRVTSVGRFLRKTSLDELPQLLNVIAGEMSLVGPRPALIREAEKYQPWQRRRLSMKPGLTCLWQVSGRNNIDFETWMRLDLEYIDNWSLWLDVKIIVLTIKEVLSGGGQ